MRKKMEKAQKSEIAAVDLFCGIGGLTKGLSLAGIDVVAGLDNDLSCKFSYKKNNGARFYHKDISRISGNSISELYPNAAIKVLVGCAPCQPFSKYSSKYRKKGYTDEKWKLLLNYSQEKGHGF